MSAPYPIIPLPDHINPSGKSTFIGPGSVVKTESGNDAFEVPATYLQEWLGNLSPTGSETPVEIRFRTEASRPDEGYTLEIDPTAITIEASTQAGAFYAVQSLIQLTRPWATKAGEPSSAIPCGRIEDAPAFKYRGMLLDVGRYYFPVAFIKQFIDLMARYKMNTFHWHLTEDQGWRIEIKKYPKLQEIAAYRKETMVGHLEEPPHRWDGKPYGGYYTQDEIREVVEYARLRSVTIIPEIELPGHAQAAIAAYPELGCLDKPLDVATKWGISPNVYCPSEHTFQFLEDVLTEVMELFPSQYIHIGGDECLKEQWKANALCQQIIKENGLADEFELQSWFIRRIERFLNKHGKRLIGWDEILEGGLAPHATVMSWRGESGGIEAASMGQDVIMTPLESCYFNMYQALGKDEPLAHGSYVPLEKVYSYNPLPKDLPAEKHKYVLGAQGSVWTEYIQTPELAEYMVYPRMQALAEVLWSDHEKRDYSDFVNRLRPHMDWLQREGVRVGPIPDGNH